MRVLLVEDEPELAEAIRDALGRVGMIVDAAATLADAVEFVRSYAYDVVVLDRQLPDGDGIALLPTLKDRNGVVPVLVLTAQGDIADRVAGLDAGADDYMAKPFDVTELVARLHAISRRAKGIGDPVIMASRLAFDVQHQTASVGEEALSLTRRETLVLGRLVSRLDRLVPRTVLMEAVFGSDDSVLPNALDTHVSRLRRKLIDAECGLTIEGVRGVGYLLRRTS